jgi:hypothetical protein
VWNGDPQKHNFAVKLQPHLTITGYEADGRPWFSPEPGYVWDGDPQKNNFAVKELPPCKSIGPHGITVLNPAKIPCREVPLPYPEDLTPLTPEQFMKSVKQQ